MAMVIELGRAGLYVEEEKPITVYYDDYVVGKFSADLYIEDLHGDTLIYSELTKVRIKQIRPDRGITEIRKISLQNAWLNLVIEPGGGVNLEVLIDRLKKPHVPPEMKNRLHIHEITMNDGRFSLTKTGHGPLRASLAVSKHI